jgi:hypothetical protein
MGLIIGIVVTIIMAVIAYKKGFNPLFWILSGGVIGLVVVLCLPSANAVGIDDMEKEKRRKRGNTVGAVLSVIAIIIIVIGLLFALRIIR